MLRSLRQKTMTVLNCLLHFGKTWPGVWDVLLAKLLDCHMFKKPMVTIDLGNDKFSRSAMRCFESGGTHIIILGVDHDDHDVWKAAGDGHIELVGTLKVTALERAHDTDLSKKVSLNPQDFMYLQPSFNQFSIEAKRVSMRALAGTYAYREVCRCGEVMDSPVGLCKCKLNPKAPAKKERAKKSP
jgi:hypothetical protein